jgi:hypothetical protein
MVLLGLGHAWRLVGFELEAANVVKKLGLVNKHKSFSIR